LEQTLYHVQLKGRTVGPYDRRTIVGMRIRKALSSGDILVGADGTQLTVADLIGKRGPDFSPTRSGSYSLVQATYTAAMTELRARGAGIPSFRGEMEVRVQNDVLRLAGRFRQRFAWKEDRVKLPLKDFAHARVRGSLVDLWLRAGKGGDKLHRMTLELFTPESAGQFVDWLPQAKPLPKGHGDAGAVGVPTAVLVAGMGVLLALGIVLMAVLRHH
jgi:hypothetical protein